MVYEFVQHEEEVVKDNPNHERERTCRKGNGEKKLVACTSCQSFVSNRYWSKHMKYCHHSVSDNSAIPVVLLQKVSDGYC